MLRGLMSIFMVSLSLSSLTLLVTLSPAHCGPFLTSYLYTSKLLIFIQNRSPEGLTARALVYGLEHLFLIA